MKIAAHQDLTISLHSHRADSAIRVRIERICQAGSGIEPGDVITGLSADGPKVAAGQNLAVRLHNDAIHKRIERTGRVRVE